MPLSASSNPSSKGIALMPKAFRSYMAKGKFLVAGNSSSLAACVYVELRGDRGYLGLLGVDPLRQGTGLGRRMMDAAENYFREAGCQAVDLRVISARTPLPAFYRHLATSKSHRSLCSRCARQGSLPLHPHAKILE